MSTQTLERVDPTLEHDGPKCAHIVKPTKDKLGADLVTESRVFGTPVEALCGHIFVVTRDPKVLPLCEGCKQAYDEAVGWHNGEPVDA